MNTVETPYQSPKIYRHTFVAPDGTTRRVFDKHPVRFLCLPDFGCAGDYKSRYGWGKISTTPKRAEKLVRESCSVRLSFKDGLKESVAENYVVIQAETVEAPRYHYILEHNRWEVETWCYAFPATPQVESLLRDLEHKYRNLTTKRYTHHGVIDATSRFTFAYDRTEQYALLFREFVRKTDCNGRVKPYWGGSYTGPLHIVEDESRAVELLTLALEFARPIYKGYVSKEVRI